MLLLALWIAMGCAACGAFTGNRAAWVLLPSVVLCLYLDYRGVPFDFARWVTLDLIAIALIAVLTWKPDRLEWAILALFVAGWVAYALGDPIRHIGSWVVSIAQLLLTFPLARFLARLKHDRMQPDRWNEFDLMVIA